MCDDGTVHAWFSPKAARTLPTMEYRDRQGQVVRATLVTPDMDTENLFPDSIYRGKVLADGYICTIYPKHWHSSRRL